ncbi:NAD(P)/FAD-dependent oxidoreductase [Candidatus Saccharibacteria bacterium]|nr:NAD(P)/FAD-dependent oxidoreductase [Candidatus Saccharibacteria bacterium]
MSKKYDYDYIVIGSGPAGSTIATSLAQGKKRVCLIEGGQFGGANLNSRDIPYGINLDFAHNYAQLKTYPAMSGQEFHYNFPTIVSHTEHTISTMRATALQKILDSGVTYLEGYAHFLDPNTVSVNNAQYTASNFILATGSRLKCKEISGLDSVNYLTPDTALKIRRLPKYVFVVGGGPTGCEIASYFAELGTKVILMERSARILPSEDKEVSQTLTEYFTNELGVRVIPSAKVVAIEQDNLSKRVIFNSAGQEKFVRVDCIVLATGSAPSTDYGLENAGVKYKNSGIIVDKSFQTSARHIYAIGDCTGNKDSSTERAEYEASILSANLLHKSKLNPNYTGFIRQVNTYPNIATVGMNEYNLLSSDRRHKKSIIYLKDLPSAQAHHQKYGFVKLLSDSNGKLLGGTIVAPDATNMALELSLAIRHRQSVLTIASTPYPTNSLSYAIKLSAQKLAR